VEGECQESSGELVKRSSSIVNRETLMVMAFNLKLRETPFRGIHDVLLSIAPEIPFKADLATVDWVKNMGGYPETERCSLGSRYTKPKTTMKF